MAKRSVVEQEILLGFEKDIRALSPVRSGGHARTDEQIGLLYDLISDLDKSFEHMKKCGQPYTVNELEINRHIARYLKKQIF
jgi:hypothetical protein